MPDSRKEKEEEALRKAVLQCCWWRSVQKRHNFIVLLNWRKKRLYETYWTVIRKDDSHLIYRVIELPYPNILFSVVVKPTCSVEVLLKDVKVQKIGKYKVPSTITDTNTLNELLQYVRQCDSDNHTCNSCSPTAIIQLVLSLLWPLWSL